MLIRQTILYMPAQLLGPLAQFVAAVVWTHWMQPDAYGVLTTIMAAQELAYIALLSWWSAYMLRFLGNLDSDPKSGFQKSENTILWASAGAQALFGIGTLVVFRLELTVPLVFWTVMFTTSRCIGTHLSERARARGMILSYTVMQLCGPVVGFGMAYALVSLMAPTPQSALAGFAIAQCLGLLWAWRAMGLTISIARPDRDMLWKALVFGVPLIVGGALSWFSINGIRIVVEQMNGIEALGLISVGWGLGQRLASVAAMLVTAAAYPLAVAKLKDGSMQDALWQLSLGGALLLGILMPTAVGIILVTPVLVPLLIAEPFRDVTLAVLPLAALAGALKNFRVHFFDQTIILVDKTYLTLALNGVEVVTTLSACLYGAYAYGMLGAVVGCLVGTIVGLLFAAALCVYQLELPIPWDAFGRIAAATLVMALAVYGLHRQPVFGGQWLHLASMVAAGGAAYILSLAALYPRALVVRLRRLRSDRAAGTD
jgi:O-antigen/teichoic acid export membrane protein